MWKRLLAFGQPAPIQHMSQHHATMSQDVALKCCERLARPLDSKTRTSTINLALVRIIGCSVIVIAGNWAFLLIKKMPKLLPCC